MSDLPLSAPRPTSRPKGISTFSEASTGGASSSFGSAKSSISRKKPLGLDISASLKSTRAAPGLPGGLGGSSSSSSSNNNRTANAKDLLPGGRTAVPGTRDDDSLGLSEAEKLRRDIEKLQLHSASSSNHSLLDDTDSPPRSPVLETLSGSSSKTSSSTSNTKEAGASKTKKKSAAGGTGSSTSKKKKVDRDGLEMVQDEDLEMLADLGAGNGGSVTKVWNKKRNCVMARKLILVDAKPAVRKQILRELQIMADCSSPHIVRYYGCFPVDVHVGLVMEFMDAGSLDHIYRKTGAVPIEVVGKVAEAVLRGLLYLYDTHRIIHRDIKPSNVLANTAGEIKICDFGVSGELINSIANTFVGTSTYMSPERIQGSPYSIKSDVWSLGISLIELATARFPFQDSPEDDDEEEEYDPDPTLPISTKRPELKAKKKSDQPANNGGASHSMSILDLLQHIVNEPAPKLASSSRSYPPEAVAFVQGCLEKDITARNSPQDLLQSDWITQSRVTQADLKVWACGLSGKSSS